MRRLALATFLLPALLAAGCGDSEGTQLKPGQAPPRLTEEEKVRSRSEQERVDEAEKANTPTAGPPRKR
jgi:hypothetical protein